MMAKDLTSSPRDRQNILNNRYNRKSAKAGFVGLATLDTPLDAQC
jgi:hypothetical protein